MHTKNCVRPRMSWIPKKQREAVKQRVFNPKLMSKERAPKHARKYDQYCWIRGAHYNHNHRGSVGIRHAGKTVAYLATRLAYWFAYGKDPGKLNVLHHCDNMRCINPKHLYLGTQQDNVLDRVARDPTSFKRRNEDYRAYPLTKAELKEAFELREQKWSVRDLAIRLIP